MRLDTGKQIARRSGFTLPELLIASSVSLLISGFVLSLLWLAVKEDRLGLGCATVEEQAYVLQGNLTKTLRIMSANQGMSPDYSMPYTASSGNVVGYHGAYLFKYMTNGSYATEHIVFNSTNGTVTFTDTSGSSAATTVWGTNTSTCIVSNVWFNSSLNPDGSVNSSLVNVALVLNDNGFAGENPTNNCASIYRSFSVQLRGY